MTPLHHAEVTLIKEDESPLEFVSSDTCKWSYIVDENWVLFSSNTNRSVLIPRDVIVYIDIQ